MNFIFQSLKIAIREVTLKEINTYLKNNIVKIHFKLRSKLRF